MKYGLHILLFFMMSHLVSAQAVLQKNVTVKITLPSIAILDMEPNNSNISLSITAPTEAGEKAVSTATNNTKWLNFTSAVAMGTSRKITAELIGTLPTGVNLKLQAGSYAGSGAGTLGASAGIISLSNTAQTIIDNIGGAYTGNGQNNGYNLTYSLEIANYALLKSQTVFLPVVYTLMDN